MKLNHQTLLSENSFEIFLNSPTKTNSREEKILRVEKKVHKSLTQGMKEKSMVVASVQAPTDMINLILRENFPLSSKSRFISTVIKIYFT